jgi:chromosome segregation ATPase
VLIDAMINEEDYIVFDKTEFFKIFQFYKTGYLKSLDEIEELKEKLSQKIKENQDHDNQIEHLNGFISELEKELDYSKMLSKEYSQKLKEFQNEQQMIDELNKQTLELGNMIMNVNEVVAEASKIKNFQEDDLNELENKIAMLTGNLDNLRQEKEQILKESAKNLETLNYKFKEQEESQKNQEAISRNNFLQLEEKYQRLNQIVNNYTESEKELKTNLDKAHETIQLLNVEKELAKFELNIHYC